MKHGVLALMLLAALFGGEGCAKDILFRYSGDEDLNPDRFGEGTMVHVLLFELTAPGEFRDVREAREFFVEEYWGDDFRKLLPTTFLGATRVRVFAPEPLDEEAEGRQGETSSAGNPRGPDRFKWKWIKAVPHRAAYIGVAALYRRPSSHSADHKIAIEKRSFETTGLHFRRSKIERETLPRYQARRPNRR